MAPFRSQQQFCRDCAKVYYEQNPGKWLWEYEIESMPPLGQFLAGRGFVPDYSILLMFDEFMVDGRAYERIIRERPAWLGEWPRLMDLLVSEGAVSPIDLHTEAAPLFRRRGGMTGSAMKNPEDWAPALRHYESLALQAQQALGEAAARQDLSWRYDSTKIGGVRGTDGEVHSLASCLLGAHSDSPEQAELEEYAVQQLRMHLKEVNAALAVAAEKESAAMVWAPYARYAEQRARWRSQDVAAARQFFNVAFPAYRPGTIEQFAKIRGDRRIRELRDTINAAAESGELMDPAYPQRTLEQVLRIERRISKMRQISGWVSAVVGSIPVPGAGPVSTLIAEGVSAVVERKMKKPLGWFYVVSDGTGHS